MAAGTFTGARVTILLGLVLAAAAGAHILNCSAEASGRGLIRYTTVTIGYSRPWRRVHDMLISAAQQTEGILADPKPFVLQTSINDSDISYELNAYTAQANRIADRHSDLHRHIQQEFATGGVEIMAPCTSRPATAIRPPSHRAPPDAA